MEGTSISPVISDLIPSRFSYGQKSTEIPQKKVRGYISKREKLKQETEKLGTKTNEQYSTVVNHETHGTSSYAGTLLNIPNRIGSALEVESKAHSNTIPKRQIISLKTEHVSGVNAILWCGSFGEHSLLIEKIEN